MKFAPTIGSNLTGRLGGIVASHNTYGTYFRRYVIPVNRNTSGQQAQRNAFAQISQLWRSQSPSQQNAWTMAGPQNTRANSTGGSLQLTGQALFMSMNTLRRRIGLPTILAAPSDTDVPSITLPTVVLDLDGSLTITFDGGDDWNAAGGGILISASPLLSAGRNFNSQYTNVGSVIFPAAAPQAFQLPYDTAAGGRVTLRFRSTTPDGRLSDLTFMDLTTAKQSVWQETIVTSATTATVYFHGDITAADFATGDFGGAWKASVTAIAQGGANYLLLTGTGMTTAAAFTLTPTGAAALYVPPASGLTDP